MVTYTNFLVALLSLEFWRHLLVVNQDSFSPYGYLYKFKEFIESIKFDKSNHEICIWNHMVKSNLELQQTKIGSPFLWAMQPYQTWISNHMAK